MSYYYQTVTRRIRKPFNAKKIAQRFIKQIAQACVDWQADDEKRIANGEVAFGPFDVRHNIEARISDIEGYLDADLSEEQFNEIQLELACLLDEQYPRTKADA